MMEIQEVTYDKNSKYRDKLSDDSKKHIQTTMIGAISIFEEMFPELVSTDTFQNYRDKVLDLGNSQIRKSKNMYDSYNITRRIFKTSFSVGE